MLQDPTIRNKINNYLRRVQADPIAPIDDAPSVPPGEVSARDAPSPILANRRNLAVQDVVRAAALCLQFALATRRHNTADYQLAIGQLRKALGVLQDIQCIP